jgi:hypothetical protein
MNNKGCSRAAVSVIAPLTVALCLLLGGLAAECQTAKALATGTSTAVLGRWHAVGGDWRDADGGLRGAVDATARGFAIADDAPFAGPQTLEAVTTPLRRMGDSWSAGGLCLYERGDCYWRLALVESPDARSRYAELTLQNEGAGIGEAALRVMERTEQPLNWKWNTSYRLRLTLAPDRIVGEVFSMDGVRRWRIAYRLTGTAYVRAGWPAVGVQGMETRFVHVTQTVAIGAEADAIRCADLEERPARSVWLSLPNSRLVVNPNMSSAPPVPASIAPCLPVSLAYYTGETPIRLPYLWAWQFGPANGAPPAIEVGPNADFSPRAAAGWKTERATAAFDGASVRFSVAEVPFGSLSTTVTVDLDRTPSLLVRVPKSEGQWALKVNAGTDAVDTYLQHDTTQTGNFIYDIPAATGWHGRRTFRLLLFAIGAKGSKATISGLRFAGTRGELSEPVVKEAGWYPHKVTSRAETPAADVKVESEICMPDERTVAQHLRIREASGTALTLTGQLPPGKARWDNSRHALLFQGQGFQAVVTVSRAARWLGQFDSSLEAAAGGPVRAEIADGGAWAVALDGTQAGNEIVVTACFGRPGEPVEPLLEAASRVSSTEGFHAALDRQEGAWNERLGRVPHPLGFAVHSLDARGAAPEAIRRTYYKAWVFLLADSLPPLPENGFAYPQIACGKPSLWSEGARGATATSQWESFLAMQYLAFADPALAWDAYAGQMTLVTADGSLGGEGLPSRHAQTAWVLYSLTGDRQRLSSVYPGLKRLLLWKAANPRWIYHNSTPEDQKDSEFVIHALMDMEYARRIAGTLAQPEEESFWKARSAQLAADYHRWFWDGAGRNYRLYRTSTGKGESPNEPWNLQGLVLPPDILRPSERDSLLRLFRASVHKEVPFLIPALSGFPKYNFTLRGLWQYGTPEEAALLIEAALRDTTLAGEFSENYTQSFPPAPTGVVPSVFGAAQIVDNVLWHNGVMPGDGLPILVRVPHAHGVRNLRIRGAAIDLVIDGDAGRLSLQGNGLRALRIPASFQSTPLPEGTPRWLSVTPEKPQLALQPAL